MSHSALREDKTCLNCRYVVENRFCSNCGQENTDSRQTFYHLFIHFFEDLTHYENAFWKTIKNLLFKPGALTKAYLSGKRLSFLPPVKLYIFISFITFLLIALLSSHETTEKVHPKIEKTNDVTITFDLTNKDSKKADLNTITTVQQLDSINKIAPEAKKLSKFRYWIAEKLLTIKNKSDNKEIMKKFPESFVHNFPKVLFIFMPFFAFSLWVFHSKKRWFYFDHGIFTLHYFSFVLLVFLILFLSNNFIFLFQESDTLKAFLVVLNLAGYAWMIYYFFSAHLSFYSETKTISFAKSTLILFINSLLMSIITALFAYFTIINLK